MPIEFTCPHCESLLRVEDANAGKRARCPHCGAINRIPGEIADPTPEAPVSQQFFIDSVSGQTYGPILKSELDSWVSQGRVSANCMIRGTGQATGQPASIYYPALGELKPEASFGSSSQPTRVLPPSPPQKQPSENPYSAPSVPINKQGELETIVVEAISPVRIDLGQVFTLAYQLFTRNLGLLVGVAIICLIPQLVINGVEVIFQDRDGNLGPLAWMVILVFNLIQTYLVIGQTRISLGLLRGRKVEFGELFNGGDKFFPIIGFSILVAIPMICGFLLLIVPGIFLVLYFWPCYSLIIDYKAKVFDSFGIAFRIGEVNLLNSFVLGLASFGIGLLGLMACGVGIIFASGYVSVLWAAAYLMMSGQLAIRANQ